MWKRPTLWPAKWILHHDSDLAHSALRVCKILAKKSITKVDHTPYLHDIVLCNFWLFPKLKIALKVQRFAYIPDIKHSVMYCEIFWETI
jgi:hypothetical protein